jgi:hypothetical protein
MSNRTIQKIDEQLKRIDDLIEKLLDGIAITEMSSYQRFMIVSRLLGLSQRGMALRQTCELDHPENRENLLIAALMRQMRGEMQASEMLRIVEKYPVQGLPEGEQSDDGTID